MRRSHVRCFVFAGLLSCGSALALEPPETPQPREPLWEAGLVGSAATLPDYPGADRNRLRVLPLPYAIYRGRTLRADNGGLRGRYRFTPDAELDLSFGGALPADSSGNPARTGMPDLDLLLEIGPRLTLTFARPSAGSSWSLALPVRAVFSTDFTNIHSRGVLAAPELAYADSRLGASEWRARFSAGPVFASAALTDYFYTVEPRYARAGRAAYDADAGYIESRLTAAFSRKLPHDLILFLFARASSLQGSANADSPLLRDRFNYSAGLGLAWTFRRSTETVAAED